MLVWLCVAMGCVRDWISPKHTLKWDLLTMYVSSEYWQSTPTPDVSYDVTLEEGVWSATVCIGHHNYDLWFTGNTEVDAKERCEQHWKGLPR